MKNVEKLYNREWKESFLVREPETSKQAYEAFFLSLRGYEESLEKDIVFFSLGEIYQSLESIYIQKTTLLAYIAYWKKYARYLLTNNFISSNSYSSLELNTQDAENIKVKPVDSLYTEEEIDELIEYYSQDAKQLVAMNILAHYHGISFEEMSNMELDDLRTESDQLQVRQDSGEFRIVNITYARKKQLLELSEDTKVAELMIPTGAVVGDRYTFPRLRLGDKYVWRAARHNVSSDLSEKMEATLIKGYIQEKTRNEPIEWRIKNTLIYNSGFAKNLAVELIKHPLKSWKEVRFNKRLASELAEAYPERNMRVKPNGELAAAASTKLLKVLENEAFVHICQEVDGYDELMSVTGVKYPDDLLPTRRKQ